MIDPVYCVRCKQPLDKADAFCRHCGADQRRPTAPSEPEQTTSISIPGPSQPPSIPPGTVPVYYKTCPVCGQPAVLSMPACGRCGTPYPPLPYASDPAPPPLPPVANAFPPPSQSGAKNRIPGLVIIGILLALLLGAILISGRRAPQAPVAEDAGGSLVQSSGPFHERPSPIETPTITINSTVPEAVLCVFQDHTGHTYELRVDPDQTASIQMPAGDYDFQIDPGNPAVRGESGDATFRRYRAYDLTLTEAPADYLPERRHIGDSP